MQFAALASRVGAHPHNWPLQIAAEWGLPALGLLAFAVFKLRDAIRRTVASEQSFTALTLTAMVALSLGLVDGNLTMPVSQIGATFAVGMLIGAATWNEPRRESRRTSAAFMVATAFVAVVASGIVIEFAARTLPDQSRSIPNFHQRYPDAWLVPRFWEQGNLL